MFCNIMTSSILKLFMLKCVLVWLIQEMEATLQNVARNRPAFQAHSHDFGEASNAVDGNVDGAFAHGSCSHTANGNFMEPWWKVDLGNDYLVEAIIVYNREDCCWNRLSNVYVDVSNDKRIYRPFAFHSGVVPRSKTIYPEKPMTAQWLKIYLKDSGVLSFCEVKVMAKRTMRKVYFDKTTQEGELHVKVNSFPVPMKGIMKCMEACSRTEKQFFMRLMDQCTPSPYFECYCSI